MMDFVIVSVIILTYATALFLNFKRKKIWAPVIISGTAIHFIYLLIKTVSTGHAPFSGAYGSLVFFSFILSLGVCITIKKSQNYIYLQNGTLIIALILLLGALIMPSTYKYNNYLPPALKSPLFLIHVPIYFLGYAYLAFSFVLATAMISKKNQNTILVKNIIQVTRIGYVLITAGIIIGSIWAFICWGRFWGWDSKENWALITWLIYTFALHSRFINKNHFRLALILGFFVILFTYLGVMFILPGLHSYK